MARYFNECSFILRNLSLEIRSRCQLDDQYCCYLHCCFVNRRYKEVWETWYFWFGVAIVCFLLLTSAASFAVSMCSRKQQHLIRIRVRNVDPLTVTAISGPDGIIQPSVAVASLAGKGHPRRDLRELDGPDAQSDSRPRSGASGSSGSRGDSAYYERFGPLDPAYPPVQPVTIVRGSGSGSGPAHGYRHTDSYTELVLPPGYVDTDPSLGAGIGPLGPHASGPKQPAASH